MAMYVCPVCGYDELPEPPWTDGSGSLEFCPSCGIQFGYYDAAGGDEEARQSLHVAWRERWRAGGMHWSSPGEAPPSGWDPISQLRRVTDDD
jgi:hypothetical protein